MLNDFFHFIEFIFVFALAVLVLFFVLLFVVSKMPPDNPMRAVLTALSRRVGLTAALLFVDPLATAVPVGGEVFDVVTIIGLAIYWYTFFSHMGGTGKPPAITATKR
jgi:hypothetical protein